MQFRCNGLQNFIFCCKRIYQKTTLITRFVSPIAWQVFAWEVSGDFCSGTYKPLIFANEPLSFNDICEVANYDMRHINCFMDVRVLSNNSSRLFLLSTFPFSGSPTLRLEIRRHALLYSLLRDSNSRVQKIEPACLTL